jgi:porin
MTLAILWASAVSAAYGQQPSETPEKPEASQPTEPVEDWPPVEVDEWPPVEMDAKEDEDGEWKLFSLDEPYITGDWGGARARWKEEGFTFNMFVNYFYQKAMHGGLELNGSGRSSATLDILADFDLGKMGVVEGGLFHLHARKQWGFGINVTTGALSRVNDDAVRGDQTFYVDNVWYEQATPNGKWAFRIGYLDPQTYVERNAFANSEDKQFWNAALDNNPLVTYIAFSGLGIAAFHRPTPWYTLTLSVSDAETILYKPGFSTAFHDRALFFVMAENAFHVSIPSKNGPLKGNYRIGMAYDPRVRPVYDSRYGTPRERSRGDDYTVYASFDQVLYREGPETSQGLGWFLRYGYRRGDIAQVNRFWSTGVQYEGLFPQRDKDVLGFAIASLVLSPEFRRYVNPDADPETIYELYYAISVTDWLVITPDIQYVTSPGGDDRNDDLVTLGVRTRFSF